MGGGRWSADDWVGYTATNSYASKTTDEIFSKSSMDKDLDPQNIKIRESRDSDHNPNSNAIIIALDVTGSMSCVLDAMARKGLNTLVTEIYDRKPVTDPQIMCMGIGDVAAGDRAPLQVTQFEADIRIAQQLEKIYLEGGGGGNHFESYTLAWYFAAFKTSTDAFEKRGKKGYLFTIGDEEPTPLLTKSQLERVFGHTVESDVNTKDLLDLVLRQWEVFHIIVEEGSHYRYAGDKVSKKWKDLLGQRVIHLADHKKLAEVVVSTIQVIEGESVDNVANTWDGTTALIVKKSLGDLTTKQCKKNKVVEL